VVIPGDTSESGGQRAGFPPAGGTAGVQGGRMAFGPPQWRAKVSASQGLTIPRYSSGTSGCPTF